MKWRTDDPPKRLNKKEVLLQIKSEELGFPDSICVGYPKFYENKDYIFVVPGRGGHVKSWCDCLGAEFEYPKNMDNDQIET